MPLDAKMPDASSLVRAFDLDLPTNPSAEHVPAPVTVHEDEAIAVTAITVTHGRAIPALAYRFETADGSVVFSGDTSPNSNIVALARGADVLVHAVADLQHLQAHGYTGEALERMAALHTNVATLGRVAQSANVRELILTHYIPPEPDAITEAEWAQRAGRGFAGTTTAGSDGLRKRVMGPAARADAG
jgi:ribonuclease BN (tRNA processing enzyme)